MEHREKPELLMPAGSLEKLRYAYAYGADAVYLGVPFFSLRARENEFSLEDLASAIEIGRAQGKKVYVTANIFSKNRKLKPFAEQFSEWAKLKPDAFIMSDPGLMMMAREKHPEVNIHLSVQANCMNWQTVRFWQKSLGVSRIILSRELHVDEVREIKQRVPDIELEAFVHGAICIAYSGRCLMSSYMSHRDANQGVCDNSCREKYKVFEVDREKAGSDYYIEDLRSAGQFYEISEDENGTFLMNAKDLRLIEHLKEIYEAGVCSFKVEGRTKSLNYVSLVARAYRKAIDDFWSERGFDSNLIEELEKVANRGYDTGFMVRQRPGAESQTYDTGLSRSFNQQFGGLVLDGPSKAPEGFIAVEARNKISLGQDCEVIYPGTKPYSLTMSEILNKDLQPVEAMQGGNGVYYVKAPGLPRDPFGIVSIKLSSRQLMNR